MNMRCLVIAWCAFMLVSAVRVDEDPAASEQTEASEDTAASGQAEDSSEEASSEDATAEDTNTTQEVTTMSDAAEAGATTIEVASTDGLDVGDDILIGDEANTIAGIGSLVLEKPLENAHPPGTTISKVVASAQSAPTDPDTLSEAERMNVLRAQAKHGAAKIFAHKKADVHQAMTAAINHMKPTEVLADQAKDFALKRAGRKAVRFDNVAGKQEHATWMAALSSNRRDTLLKRADDTHEYRKKADAYEVETEEEEREKSAMADLHLESAVGAAHKEKEAEDAWVSADQGAEDAKAAKTAAETKYEKDKEIAERAEEESLRADRESLRKAAASKALAERSEEKTIKWQESNKAKQEAKKVQLAAAVHDREASEAAETSEAEAKKATADREIAEKEYAEFEDEEKAKKHKCKVEAAIAGATVQDAIAASEVHVEKVKEANQAAKQAARAKIQLGLNEAATKAANAAVVAAETSNMAKDAADIEWQQH